MINIFSSQHRLPDGTRRQAVICRQPSFPGCCASRVEQPAFRNYICSVTAFIPVTSEYILQFLFQRSFTDVIVTLC